MPDADTDTLLTLATRRALAYLAGMDSRPVRPTPEAVAAALARLDEPLPDGPTDPQAVLRLLDEAASPATMAMAGPRFFGFVIGGSLPVTLAANWLAGAWDQNSAFYNAAPATAVLEQVALRWLLDVLGLPSNAAGAFVTGATVANFTALAAARNAVLQQAGWNVEADGLFGAPPITVVVSAEAHPTLFKSLGMLGLGRNRVVRVPVDGQGRMRADTLPDLHGPTIVCLQAGNLNTGAFDPFEPICDWAHQAGAWVHVDGAFGLWAAASPSLSHLAAGMAQADSWATDGHKWLNVPYDCGLAFVRDEASLRGAMAVTAEYLPTSNSHRNPSDYTPELSRRGRGVEVWAALRSLGRAGLAEMIERCWPSRPSFRPGVPRGGLRGAQRRGCSTRCWCASGSPEVTQRVILGVQEDGTCWAGITVWQGRTAMRISVSSWATTDEDVQRSLEAILRVAR